MFKAGAVYRACRSGLPIVPSTVACRRCWQLRSWDRLQISWPFTRGVIHVGAPVLVPAALDGSDLEAWRLRLQDTLRSPTQTTDEHIEGFWLGGRPRRDL